MAYAEFIASGQLLEVYPQAADQPLMIEVVCLHEPSIIRYEITREFEAQCPDVGLCFTLFEGG